jgi:hypothetical protein
MNVYSIDEKVANSIESMTDTFMWRFSDSTVLENAGYDDICQFVVTYNDYTSEVKKVVEYLSASITEQTDYKIKRLIKAKFNLTLSDSEKMQYAAPHADFWELKPCLSCIYYVTESDGDTVFFNKSYGDKVDGLKVVDRVSPIRGTYTLFDSMIYHAKAHQKATKRIAGNFIWLLEE